MKLLIIICFILASSFCVFAPPKKNNSIKTLNSHGKQEKKDKDDELLDGILNNPAHQEAIKKAEQIAKIRLTPAIVEHTKALSHMKSDNAKSNFFLAVKQNNIEECKSFLKKGMNCNVLDSNNNTALIYLLTGFLSDEILICEMVDLLLAHGLNPNLLNNQKNGPLVVASEYGKEEIVKKLINARAKINTQNQDGFTALMLAASKNHSSIIRILLEAGARDLQETEDGYTALMLAFENENSQAAQVLINETDFDLNKCNKRNFTALHFAIDSTSHDLVKDLLARGMNKIDMQSSNGITALMLAASKNYPNIIRMLLDAGAKNLQDSQGYTALMVAIENGNIEAAQMLINETDFDLNLKEKRGYTALHFAIDLKSSDLIKNLLARGIHLEQIDESRGTPLIYAAWRGDEQFVKMLIEAGANLNVKNKHGNTALMHAVAYDKIEIADVLLSYGADPKEKNCRGINCIQLARDEMHNTTPEHDGSNREVKLALAQLIRKHASKNLEQKNNAIVLRKLFQTLIDHKNYKQIERLEKKRIENASACQSLEQKNKIVALRESYRKLFDYRRNLPPDSIPNNIWADAWDDADDQKYLKWKECDN